MMFFNTFLRHSARLLLLASVVPAFAGNSSQASQGKIIRNRAPLQQNAFDPLPLGAIQPQGWLHRQLEIQANGLTGYLDEIWADVGPNSGWLGGTGESWERGPYYLDGLLPLAYLLNDARLKAKAQRWVDWTLEHQQPDGEIGPPSNNDWWPRMVMLKVLTQYQETTGDPRVIPLMRKYFSYELKTLPLRPLRDWGKYRWQDNVYSVLWLYQRTGDPSLLQLVRLLHQQGYDWEAGFSRFPYTHKVTNAMLDSAPKAQHPDYNMQTHGVNNAMALKAAPLWWLVTGNASDRTALDTMLLDLDRYHGLPNGMFSADEHFAGLDPSQGIELCAVVESMFSYEDAFSILGDPMLAERLERVAFNALPGTISDDMWSHQYDQQPNQIECTRAPRDWTTNGNDSNLFGLAPNFGCCTANLHQGWPKFTESLWMATPLKDGAGLVTVAYAPSRVRTQLHGTWVGIDEATEYPFRNSVQFTVHPAHPVKFPLVLRIPDWSPQMQLSIDGASTQTIANPCDPASHSTCNTSDLFYRIDRTWHAGDTVRVTFAMPPRVTHWYNRSVALERGPLVFSLPLGENWSSLKHYAQKSNDWQITSSTPWNYALAVPQCGITVRQLPLGPIPFSAQNAAVQLQVWGRRLPQWKMVDNSAAPPPVSPVQSAAPLQRLTFIPYAAAKLRVTALPSLDENLSCEKIPANSSANIRPAKSRIAKNRSAGQ